MLPVATDKVPDATCLRVKGVSRTSFIAFPAIFILLSAFKAAFSVFKVSISLISFYYFVLS